MKKAIIWIVSLALVCGIAAGVVLYLNRGPEAENNAAMKLLTDSYEEGKGAFAIDEETSLFAVTEDPEGEFARVCGFISQQFAAAGYPSESTMAVTWGKETQAKANQIILAVDEAVAGAEGYRITVDRKNIRITGADNRGLMYGAYTVIKHLRANGSNVIAGCTITDTPDAGERAVMIDCGRKYYTLDWLKNFLREMAYMGYNTIELHFSDDQGTRFDIWDPEYYKTNVNGNDFSWLCGGYVGGWVNDRFANYEDVKKYLTAQEIDELMKLAKEYQLTVIPSMDSPGHCQYICRAYERNATLSHQFYYQGKLYKFTGVSDGKGNKIAISDLQKEYPNTDFDYIFSGNHITLDVTNPYGRAFILAIVEDYARFFKQYGCETFHIGGDEVRLHTNGYGSVDWADYVQEGYSKYDTCVDYINEQTGMLKELGYKVRAFSDFIDYVSDDPDYDQHIEFDPDIEISYWIENYELETAPPVSHFLGKRTVYNCLQNYCYYSLAMTASGEDGRDPETKNWGFYYSMEDRIYDYWNPTVFQWPEHPGQGTIADPEQVAGGYFLIWCDNAAQSTESEMWYGIDETGKYNMIDRMWSNIIKMCNYDVNDVLTYEEYAALRELFGYFPGYTQCSAETILPAMPEMIPAE